MFRQKDKVLTLDSQAILENRLVNSAFRSEFKMRTALHFLMRKNFLRFFILLDRTRAAVTRSRLLLFPSVNKNRRFSFRGFFVCP